ncbi:MAG: M16 family metallopeptidase, partial [Blastocatellia bacterium]
TYYAPNNAVLTLVGDFNTNDGLAKVKKYFDNIPRQPAPPSVDMTEPVQTAERRATLEDKLARLPEVTIAYKAVPGNTPDYYALVVLSAALQSGQSSRLYQKLVKDTQVAQSASGYASETRGPGALYTSVLLNRGHKTDEAEKLVYAEIERLKKEPIADWELEKAKNFTKRQLVSSIQNSLSAAILIGQYTVFYNEPNLVNTRIDKITAVTKDDVQRVANKYLKETNRTVVVTLPKGSGPTAAADKQGGAR